jgi:hypothetical protein
MTAVIGLARGVFFATPLWFFMESFDMIVSTRRVGRNLDIAGSGTGLFVFGPLLPGEIVRSLSIFFDNAAPAAGDQLQLDIAVSANSPADATAFATGRLLTVGSPRIPVLLQQAVLPVQFAATSEERYLSLLVTELAGDDTDGSVWAEIECLPCELGIPSTE